MTATNVVACFRFLIPPVVTAIAVCLTVASPAAAGQLSLVPWPVKVVQGSGEFVLSDKTVVAADPAMADEAEMLADRLRAATGFSLPVQADAPDRDVICLLKAPVAKTGPETYSLEVTPERVTLRAAEPVGMFRAAQTLLQLLPPESLGAVKAEGVRWQLPAVRIDDYSRFSWRGLMLDCSRTFQSIEYLKKTIDRLAYYKMNVLHLHLTDNQGWRLEIKKYPELTRKGAHFPAKYNEPSSHEGFYTQEEMKDLIAYARRRHVEIVPEIEMPGHSLATVACYPELSCTGKSVDIFPHHKRLRGDDNVLCAGNDETFRFLDDVLAEVAELFPSKFVHVGGDEASKKWWKSCPKCQARIKAEHLKNEEELQSYFIRRVEKMLNERGKQLIGWDEILEGGLAPNAAVMSWRGVGGGIRAAGMNHDVVMSPITHCYFDFSYARIDTLRAYLFEPVPAAIAPETAKHVLGLQANFWSHIDREPEKVDRQLFPRLLSIAERGWSPKDRRDWGDFQRRVCEQCVRLDAMGVAFERGLLESPHLQDIGNWAPSQMNEQYKPLVWDITDKVDGPGVYQVLLRYTQGAHRLGINAVELLEGDALVASDVHRGMAGRAYKANQYRLELKEHKAGMKYTIRAFVRSEGGTDSSGMVFIEKL